MARALSARLDAAPRRAGHRARARQARASAARDASSVVESCDPPNGFTATWEYGGEISWIELLRLSPASDRGARVELEHIAHVDDTRWDEFGPGAVGVGWALSLLGLASHLSSGAGVEPGESAAWMASGASVVVVAAMAPDHRI